jgi:hypothetical protein
MVNIMEEFEKFADSEGGLADLAFIEKFRIC